MLYNVVHSDLPDPVGHKVSMTNPSRKISDICSKQSRPWSLTAITYSPLNNREKIKVENECLFYFVQYKASESDSSLHNVGHA